MGALEGSGKETSITMNQLKVISDQYFSGKHNTEEEVTPTIFRLTKNRQDYQYQTPRECNNKMTPSILICQIEN